MRAAVVDLANGTVVNIIVADAAADVAPDGCRLVDVSAMPCDIGWIYDASGSSFSDPNPAAPAVPGPTEQGV